MPTLREKAGAFAHRGMLYICGGQLANVWEAEKWTNEKWIRCVNNSEAVSIKFQYCGSLSAVERYNPTTDLWEVLPPMHENRSYNVVGAGLGGHLCVCCGGHEAHKPPYIEGCTQPCPERLAPDGCWERLSPMPLVRAY